MNQNARKNPHDAEPNCKAQAQGTEEIPKPSEKTAEPWVLDWSFSALVIAGLGAE